MVVVVSVIAAMVWGCATTGGPAPVEKVETKAGPAPVEEVKAVLADFHEALMAGDAGKAASAFSEDYSNSQGGDKAAMRGLLEGLISQGVLAGTAVNMEECKIVVAGDSAVAKPVIYESPMGNSAQEYRMKREADGVWRIVSSETVLPPAVDIWAAAATGDIAAIRQHIYAGTDLGALDPAGGSTPLNVSALMGQTEAAVLLIGEGADVNARNRDGNTALHTAAFFGHIDTVTLLLEKGADRSARGSDGQTPLDIVSAPWSEELEGLYRYIEGLLQLQLDLEKIKAARLKVAALLRQREAAASDAESSVSITLPAPQMTGGRPLMDVLKDRKTTRSFARTKLPEQVLSNLLWAAWGINRPEHNLHTAPSASNQQEIDVYVALEKGLYIYRPNVHELELVLAEDLREATGTQRFVKNVPLNLVFVADHSRMYAGAKMEERIREFYSAANTGYISQNVYLFCASEGLGTVVRGLVDKEKLAKAMKLRPHQKIILSQSVGYPRGSKQK